MLSMTRSLTGRHLCVLGARSKRMGRTPSNRRVHLSGSLLACAAALCVWPANASFNFQVSVKATDDDTSGSMYVKFKQHGSSSWGSETPLFEHGISEWQTVTKTFSTSSMPPSRIRLRLSSFYDDVRLSHVKVCGHNVLYPAGSFEWQDGDAFEWDVPADKCCASSSSSQVCSGAGMCVDSSNGANHACSCSDGYAGSGCQFSDASNCNGDGDAQSDGSCNCNTGYAGNACQYSDQVREE